MNKTVKINQIGKKKHIQIRGITEQPFLSLYLKRVQKQERKGKDFFLSNSLTTQKIGINLSTKAENKLETGNSMPLDDLYENFGNCKNEGVARDSGRIEWGLPKMEQEQVGTAQMQSILR